MNRTDRELVTDVVVIGAGPVGLFAVFECGMLGLKCDVIDALDKPGGQCAALYPEKPIFDIPAHPHVTGQGLIDLLLAQSAPFGPRLHLGCRVESMTATADGWTVATSNGRLVRCRSVILASGAGLLVPNRPNWDGLEAYDGRGVSYSVGRREALRGRRVVIVGGGDSAADWAVELVDVAARVCLVHRRATFRAAPGTMKKVAECIEAGRIDFVAPATVRRLEGDGRRLEAVVVADLDGQEVFLACDELLVFFGLTTDIRAYASWGLRSTASGVEVDPGTCATNLLGVYAIGDAASHPSKLKLILTGFSEAATAARQAFRLCRPGKAPNLDYSTARGVVPLPTTD